MVKWDLSKLEPYLHITYFMLFLHIFSLIMLTLLYKGIDAPTWIFLIPQAVLLALNALLITLSRKFLQGIKLQTLTYETAVEESLTINLGLIGLIGEELQDKVFRSLLGQRRHPTPHLSNDSRESHLKS